MSSQKLDFLKDDFLKYDHFSLQRISTFVISLYFHINPAYKIGNSHLITLGTKA